MDGQTDSNLSRPVSSNGELSWTEALRQEFSVHPLMDSPMTGQCGPHSAMSSLQGLGEGAAHFIGLACFMNPQRFSGVLINPCAHVPSLLW